MPAVQIGPIRDVAVLGGGAAFPARTLTNLDVLRSLPAEARRARATPVTDEELAFLATGMEQSLGVRERAWAHAVGTPLDHAHEQTTLDLAVEAARRALDDAKTQIGEVGLILCATSTPHRMTSTLSGALGAALGAECACLDARTGCSGGLFALSTAALYLQAGVERVLLVGAETFSKIIPPAHKMAALALGDGAGALVLGRKAGASLDAAWMRTDGSLGKLISTDGALPPTAEEISRGGYQLSGQPDELTRAVPGKYSEAIAGVLTRAGIGGAQVDLFVPHQTSRALIEEVARAAGIARERAYINVEKHANIGSAGWVVALVEARAAGLSPAGTRLLLAGVGGGMSWAAAVLTC
jgi:3-oxoacyl-[acyl-carrier-protein] synthase-3